MRPKTFGYLRVRRNSKLYRLASQTFEILIRKKIPFISELLYWLLMLCMIVFFILYLIMYPTKNASDEMSTAYYILVVPEWLKQISFYALIGFAILTPIYFRAKLYKNATLTYGLDQVLIKGKAVNKTLPFDSIKEVWSNDVKDLSGQPKNKLQIVLRQKNGRQTTFRLKDYNCSDDFMETTIDTLKDVKFSFYDKEAVDIHNEDD